MSKLYDYLKKEELPRLANHLELSKEDFSAKYLKKKEDGDYAVRESPCAFLAEDRICLLEGCKPLNCQEYPFTDHRDRLYSMYSILDAAAICPVVFEILERLKKIYGFR